MKTIQLPRTVLIGKNIIDEIVNVVPSSNGIVVSDKYTYEIAGKKITELLECENIEIQKATLDEVENVKEASKKAQFLVGVGGGTVIDVAKLASFQSKKNFVSVPTSCAHDGICSPTAAIKTDAGSESIKAAAPFALIADIDILKNAPDRMIAAGIGDLVAKYTAVWDWKLARNVKKEDYGDYAASLALMAAELTSKNVLEIKSKSDEGISILMEALISTGVSMNIAGSSRPASGSEHKFSHMLDLLGKYPAMHGEQCGLGSIIMAYFQNQDWEQIRNTLKIAGCPITAKQLNVSDEVITKAILKANEIKPERYTILNHIKLNEDVVKSVLKETGVI